jgi:hypothetical protein
MFAWLLKWRVVRQILERKDGTGLEAMSEKTRAMRNEENYLIKKLFTGVLGMVCVSNQARMSLARSRWRRFHFYWARSLAASVGLRWAKFRSGTRNRFLRRRSNTDFQSVSSDKHLCLSIGWEACLMNQARCLSYKIARSMCV